MIGPPSGTRIWLVAGQTDLRKGVDGLCALVQAHLNESAFTGEVYLFRGKSGNKIKVLWATPEGMSFLYKRLNDAKFVWPQMRDGKVCLSVAQLSMLLEGIDWVRRETDARQRVKVPYGEGLASSTAPESCGGVREDAFEALTGVHVGRAIERRKTSLPGC